MNRARVVTFARLVAAAACVCACSSTGAGGAGSGGSGAASGGSFVGTGGAAGSGGNGKPALVVSSPSGYWQTSEQWTVVTGDADVTVNDGAPAQLWEGFGGAFNEKGWAALSALNDADRNRAMTLLFGDDGARFVIGRIPIGASDYAMDRYTEDETKNDTTLSSFSIDRDKQKLIPYVQAALAVRPSIRFWASPWTPPTWMKSGMKSGSQPSPFDGGTMIDDDTILKTYAQYLLKFVDAYGKQGIAIEYVAPQNEPNFDQNYPSCLWSAALYTKFVGKYLGPAIHDSGTGLEIMLGTMSNGNSGKDPSIVSAVLADSTARSYIQVMGMQWGMLGHVADVKSSGIPVWQTEHQAGNCPFSGTANCATVSSTMAPNDQAYGVETWNLIRDWIKTGITSYSAWNMVLDTYGLSLDADRKWWQDALLAVDTAAGTFSLTPAYHVFRHVSQFADPGARVVGTSGGDAIAFKNPDGSLVAVMYNSGGARKLTVALGGTRLQFDMPGNGWATVNYQP